MFSRYIFANGSVNEGEFAKGHFNGRGNAHGEGGEGEREVEERSFSFFFFC